MVPIASLACDNCKVIFQRNESAVYPGLHFCGLPCSKEYMSKTSKNLVRRLNEIRNKVLSRDNNSCTKCNTRSERLSVHHKDGSGDSLNCEDSNNNISNLVTLCNRCHVKNHRSEAIKRGDDWALVNYSIRIR